MAVYIEKGDLELLREDVASLLADREELLVNDVRDILRGVGFLPNPSGRQWKGLCSRRIYILEPESFGKTTWVGNFTDLLAYLKFPITQSPAGKCRVRKAVPQ